MAVFLGTLWISIKEVNDAFMSDVEHGIALLPVHSYRASSDHEGVVTWFFSSCGGILGYIFELRQGWRFKTHVCSVTAGLLSSCEGHLRILLEAFNGNRDASRFEVGDPVSLSSCYRDIWIPINFQDESGIISF